MVYGGEGKGGKEGRERERERNRKRNRETESMIVYTCNPREKEHTCNSSTWEDTEVEYQVQSQAGLHNKILSQKFSLNRTKEITQ